MEKLEEFSRQNKLIGEENTKKLNTGSVIVFGVGGVGSFACEALARAGVGNITVVDNDTVAKSNINRQLIALNSTLGKNKTSVIKKRINDINPQITVTEKVLFYDESTQDQFDLSSYDYVLDCIDSVKSKVLLIKNSQNTRIISAMGTGNKLCPEKLEITDISKTSYCPLARKMRTELKKIGIQELKVIYSKEEPKKVEGAPASISFVPSVAGLMMAGEVIKELIK